MEINIMLTTVSSNKGSLLIKKMKGNNCHHFMDIVICSTYIFFNTEV